MLLAHRSASMLQVLEGQQGRLRRSHADNNAAQLVKRMQQRFYQSESASDGTVAVATRQSDCHYRADTNRTEWTHFAAAGAYQQISYAQMAVDAGRCGRCARKPHRLDAVRATALSQKTEAVSAGNWRPAIRSARETGTVMRDPYIPRLHPGLLGWPGRKATGHDHASPK